MSARETLLWQKRLRSSRQKKIVVRFARYFSKVKAEQKYDSQAIDPSKSAELLGWRLSRQCDPILS